ncbi:hypothetical protein [Sinobacterium norvegicum]|nr:hypothetical protein [Sinobacterium norvegicum]
MKHSRVKLSKCRVILFDLEFYVPEAGRDKSGFCYNPWDKRCKLIGGSFLPANPEKDLSKTSNNPKRKVKSFWLWDYKSERELLEAIYKLLRTTCGLVINAHEGRVSPIMCGIGISSSDVPILFELFKRYKILSNAEAFEFQNMFRILDISQLSIATFNNSNDFLYPKTKSLILQKYMPGKKFESGKSVWDLYDANEYDSIVDRVIDEVMCTHQCYLEIVEDIRKFKALEVSEKKRVKLAEKLALENAEAMG